MKAKTEELIVLKVPFIKHYAGTIFRLGVPQLKKEDTFEHIISFEKISFIHNYFYQLPDGGNGKSCELDKAYTFTITEQDLKIEDQLSGPCRITSIQLFNERYPATSIYQSAIPDGFKPLRLIPNNHGAKHLISIELANKLVEISLTDSLRNKTRHLISTQKNEIMVDLSDFEPGFYSLLIKVNGKPWVQASIIKLFPVSFEIINHQALSLIKTIW